MKSFITTTAIGAVLLGGNAFAQAPDDIPTDIYVALPAQNVIDPDALITFAMMAFAETDPGGSFRAMSVADGLTITAFDIDDRKRNRTLKFKRKEYASERAPMQRFVREANESAPVDYLEFESDIYSVIRTVGKMRNGGVKPAKLLILGGALQLTPEMESASMFVGGDAFVASDTVTTGDLGLTPHGIGDDRDDLENVDVFFCGVMPIKLTGYEQQEVARHWGQVIALRGGRLMILTSDTTLCLEQFQSDSMAPMEFRPLDPEVVPAMVRADKSGKLEQLTSTEAEDFQRLIDQTAVDLEEERRRREVAERIAELARLEAEEALNRPPTVIEKVVTKYEDGSRFVHEPHPTVRGVTVSTGVEYLEKARYGYTHAWCYMQPESPRGLKLWIEIANKRAGRNVQYEKPNMAALQEAGMSNRDFEAARSACQFPAQ